MNKVIISGRLTKDVDLRYTATNNTPVATINVAVNRKHEDKADFFNCIAYGKTAEFINKYFNKGKAIIVNGSLQTRFYDDKDGKRVYVTEIIVEEVDFAGDKPKEENQVEVAEEFTTNDELPF